MILLDGFLVYVCVVICYLLFDIVFVYSIRAIGRSVGNISSLKLLLLLSMFAKCN